VEHFTPFNKKYVWQRAGVSSGRIREINRTHVKEKDRKNGADRNFRNYEVTRAREDGGVQNGSRD